MITNDDKDEISQAIREGLSYPLEVADGSNGSGYGGQTTNVRRLIQRTLGDVLGWNARREDPKGFKAALNNVFTPVSKAGTTYYKWTPRTYSVQADLGEITGTQAAIYTRARRTLDYVLPLLDGLKPLVETADIEDCNGVRNLVRAEITELVEQLGAIGGPVVPRVDALFEVLFGKEHWNNPDLIFLDDGSMDSRDSFVPDKHNEGQLNALRHVFHLKDEFVNVLGEEQSLTNFEILLSDLDVLRMTWQNQRAYFSRIGEKTYFGTRLVLLSRDLEVIAESVQEARDAFERVKITEAERSTLPIYLFETVVSKTADRESSITITHYRVTSWLTVAELLDWLETFATVHGIQILQEGGKYGVREAFVPMLDEMIDALDNALHQNERLLNLVPEHRDDYPFQPECFYERRVTRALDNLLSGVRRARSNAAPIDYEPISSATSRDMEEVQANNTRMDRRISSLDYNVRIIQNGGGIRDPKELGEAIFEHKDEKDTIIIKGITKRDGLREVILIGAGKREKIDLGAIKKSNTEITYSVKPKSLQAGNYEIRLTYFRNHNPCVGVCHFQIP